MTSGAFKPGHRNFHDVSAAGRKGKANSPWRHGMPWLSGMGAEDERIRNARNREHVVQKRFPGAHKRPCFSMDAKQN